tara:strand:- start:349 stop:1233 length:885 start_codon:yes stop_codon:yes gene_type:complete
MKFKILFFLLVNVLLSKNMLAQKDSLQLNNSRLIVAGGGIALTLAASYWYIENSWWAEQKGSFHFDDGADLVYALNVDKFGHFMGGLYAADIFSSTMKWASISKKKAVWYGALFGTSLQLAIEMKDAYAPYWGFSTWDLATGAAGAIWPAIQYYNEDMKAINFKFSYYKRSDIYWELDRQRGKTTNLHAWHDDYPNQTYWTSFDINHFAKTQNWPEWLNIAVGFGLDDTQYLNNGQKVGGANEWYIALDYNLVKMFKNWNTPIIKNVKYWLNYIHFPAPTIRVSPNFEFYLLFI